MASVVTMPMSRPLTLEDFEAIRGAADDGHRYELIDGSLIVTPSPTWSHQVVSSNLLVHLALANPAPDRFVVLHAPYDVRLANDSVVQSDLLVFDTTEPDQSLPLLAVEILSPSTRHIDVGLKWSRYASAGIPHFWVVDPDGPGLKVWELRDGAYVKATSAEGDETAHVALPWPVTIVPSALTSNA